MSDEFSIGNDVTMRTFAPAGGVKRFRTGDEILGRYVVESELGQGGMGVVYLCLDKVGGVKVAVKGLPPEVSHNAEEMEEVRANFQLVCALRHPSITGIRTLESDPASGLYYLVMDVAEGESLTRWMKAHGGTGLTDEKLAVLRDVAAALDYAHARQIIHRDIKPGNVIVGPDGHAQVLDFGLAAQIRSSMSRASLQVTSKSGTPAYKSPEQWKGRPQRAAADQYALAVIAYRLISGELPFDGDNLEMLGRAVMNEQPPTVTDVSASVNAALRKGLAKEPQERYPDCASFVAALSQDSQEPQPSPASSPAKWILLALLAGLPAVGIVIACLSDRRDAQPQKPFNEGRKPSEIVAPAPSETVAPAPPEVVAPAPPEVVVPKQPQADMSAVQQVDVQEAKIEVLRQKGREAAHQLREREKAAEEAAACEQPDTVTQQTATVAQRVDAKKMEEEVRIREAKRQNDARLKAIFEKCSRP